ncbi:nitrite reductase [Oxyplasma meridianum]|uniref:Nitrite reductase n=1 Tax=Oxyplasma meridianum TaxID=3073602 RepID=A0AAX4NH41_9ARCH
MPSDVEKYLKDILRTMPSEELYFEAIREIMKDLIKEYIRKMINKNQELKSEIAQVLQDFMESKIKEYDSMARMAKVTAKIGLLTTPESIKDQAVTDFTNMFRKEIEEIIKRTF